MNVKNLFKDKGELEFLNRFRDAEQILIPGKDDYIENIDIIPLDNLTKSSLDDLNKKLEDLSNLQNRLAVLITHTSDKNHKEQLRMYNSAITRYKQAIRDTMITEMHEFPKEGESIKKRNGYKIVDSRYNKLYINIDKLINEMEIQAAIDNCDVIYTNKADKDSIHLLTKRFDPKNRYLKLSIQMFNDLNQLS